MQPNIEDYRDLSGQEGITYTFMSERGRQDMDYVTYLSDLELREWINDIDRYRLMLGRTIFTYTHEYLSSHPKTFEFLKAMEVEKTRNPLRFFAPSGKEATDFLNDFENDLCILTACNRFGKTQTMLIKKLINSIPCDPNWEIFTKHGVKHRPFRGPKNVGLASYDFGFHRDTTLPMLLDWLPSNQLGVYARGYKGKGAKQVNLSNNPILSLECGTKFYFAAMSQGQAPFEGNVKHDWGWDEQGLEAAFDGADERTRTISDGRHDFGLTPHYIDGRPDTGAGSWINKLFEGEVSKGRRITTYQGTIWDIPDWIYPEKQKVSAFEKWVVEPMKLGDDKKRREGEARFFGRWHESSGLVIDEWNSDVHVIEPCDIPKHWTRVRGIDHGDKHPAACLWAAVSPGGDVFFYRDYLRTGRVVDQICEDIIEGSGNTRKKIGEYRNPRTNIAYNRYEEEFKKEAIAWNVFDARAFSGKHHDMKLSKFYGLHGLRMRQGSGHDSDTYVPILKQWFALDPNKKHFVTGEMGAPRVYVFNTCDNFIRTIKRWVWKERKTRGDQPLAKSSPTKKDDDLCDCMKLILQENPRYIGSPNLGDKEHYDFLDDFSETKFDVGRPQDRLSGY
jgi:hypothetical protein